ncbi:hypothetical protein [Streptomyces sp. GS7]|uniref:hypothetical protein n=1 Tax=Streptomyces sp. GS7 TaxID=2692234 RepID=UPI0013183D5C|nr:hypothetical protein [Streptomyces sp. GS7]QHC23607.1 hypothetical protein GR130_21755 [Streptomyces sp. GS7]
MRKLQKAAVVAAVLGSFGFVGAGTAYAHGEKEGGRGGTDFEVRQGSQCRSHDTNVDVLGEVGILNGVLGNALGGEGSPGAQSTRMGSSMGCDNSVDFMGDKGGGEGRSGGSEGREGRGDKRGDEGKAGGSEGREGKGDEGDKGDRGDKGGDEGKSGGSEGREGKGGKEAGEAKEGGEGPVRAVGGGAGE